MKSIGSKNNLMNGKSTGTLNLDSIFNYDNYRIYALYFSDFSLLLNRIKPTARNCRLDFIRYYLITEFE